jgi:c-di-GMP-binding flagellar brake protein YcgR
MSTLQIEEMQTIKLQPERRKNTRFQVAVQVELRLDGAPAATHTHTTDLSLGGCYVEMNFTLPVDSHLDMVLWLGDEKVVTKAIVVTHHPYFGNGFRFVDMLADDQSKLKRFLASLG